MKKLLLILLCVLLPTMTFAQWTVKSVPNTRLQSNEIHVSDPEDYLSDSTKSIINTALCSIRDRSDVFVVMLGSIGDAEPKHFATDLFNYWGIGDAETNNGVLLLFVEDQHALEFETGYGAETTLTDAKCEQIFRTSIVPHFRAGDYEGGLCAGIGDIVTVFGGEVPVGLVSTPPVSYDEDDTDNAMSDFAGSFLGVMFFTMVVSCVRALEKMAGKKKLVDHEETITTKNADGINYITDYSPNWSGKVWEKSGCLMFLVFGLAMLLLYMAFMYLVPRLFPEATEKVQNNWITVFTIATYLTWICIIQNRKALKQADEKAPTSKSPKTIYQIAKRDAKTRLTRILAPWVGIFYSTAFDVRINKSAVFRCPTCDSPMECEENFPLPEIRSFEEKVGAYKFTAYRCPSGHEFVYQRNGPQFNNLYVCHSCFARAGKIISKKTVMEPTYERQGSEEITYLCQHCGKEFMRSKTIPKYVHSDSSSSSSSHSSSYSSSSSSSSGSFGGGSSGGGGYSGRW